jgi:protein-tyrosine phosphatase
MAHHIARCGADISVDSAGTLDFHVGKKPDSRMRAAGEARGYRFTTVARQVTADDLVPGRFDLVLAMDRSNLAELRKLSGQNLSHVLLFGEFLNKQDPPNIPDPYYGGQAGFEKVLDMLEAACPKILDMLVASERSR